MLYGVFGGPRPGSSHMITNNSEVAYIYKWYLFSIKANQEVLVSAGVQVNSVSKLISIIKELTNGYMTSPFSGFCFSKVKKMNGWNFRVSCQETLFKEEKHSCSVQLPNKQKHAQNDKTYEEHFQQSQASNTFTLILTSTSTFNKSFIVPKLSYYEYFIIIDLRRSLL